MKGRHKKKNGSLCPINLFSLPLLLSVCFHVLVSVLISLSRSSLPASIYPLFTNPLHLANDKNSGENTSQENCDCLPCRCAKVWTYALLKKKINHRHTHKNQTGHKNNQEQKLKNNKWVWLDISRLFPYPATLLPDPVEHMFPDVVHGPADYCSNNIRNLGHQGL